MRLATERSAFIVLLVMFGVYSSSAQQDPPAALGSVGPQGVESDGISWQASVSTWPKGFWDSLQIRKTET